MPGILIFESDLEFAEGLKGELLRRGCHVDVVSDAAVGLEHAAAHPPDLILLCTELPRMNGFSVCNRLKRDPALENVPVIIMSANSSEETFQQHRNLTKKRAQDYVHKPVSIEDMLGRVAAFVSLNGHAAPAAPPPAPSAAMDELDVEEMEELDELGGDLSPSEFDHPVPAPNSPSIPAFASSAEAETSESAMNQLTDEVFGHLMQGSGLAAPSAPLASSTAGDAVAPMSSRRPSSGPSAAQHSVPPLNLVPGSTVASVLATDGYGGRSLPPPAPEHATGSSPKAARASVDPMAGRRSSRSPRRTGMDSIPPAGRVPMISEPVLDGVVSREHAAELERTLAETRSKLEAVYQELDAARAKESGGSARAHEILDLREALNKKEKEIIDLRDLQTRRDKELVSANDTLLELERKQAEAKDHLADIEKRMHTSERALQAASQDREQANKRAEGYKRKVEKSLEDLEHLTVELEELTAERSKLQTRSELAETNNADLTVKLTDATRRGDDLQADLNDSEKELASLEEQGEQLQQRLQASEALQQQTQQTLTQVSERLERHRSTEATVRDLLGQAAQRLGELG